ncbi:hypothetical protein JMJ56_31680 [Belnapia sp. T18]|uniref:Uncharacterized protein n=1 Tax=Belnapia arida TaxID=2804533 RepID=A0ABS1UD02_9PROT|nr:hypothetical protein [Belnapia arida]MBL6082529.1 hypothetical protein [Belnapia arida]
MTAAAAEAHRESLVPIVYYFASQTGRMRSPPATGLTLLERQEGELASLSASDWAAVTLVGEGYIDEQCFALLSALEELERTRRATLANMNAIQSATVGIMGLAVAAQKAIGITGIAFGLAASLFDNTTSSVLYQLPAASVRAVVLAQRDQLRQEEASDGANLLSRVTNRGLAVARMTEYLQYCAPVTINANIERILNNTRVKDGEFVVPPVRPAVSSALVQPMSAIPPGTRVVQVGQTTRPVRLDPDVQRQLATLAAAVRATRERPRLEQAASTLGLPVTPVMLDTELSAAIRQKLSASVNAADVTIQRSQMERLNQVLLPILQPAAPPAQPFPAPR